MEANTVQFLGCDDRTYELDFFSTWDLDKVISLNK